MNSPAETSRTIERPICTVASDVRNRAADREPDGCPDWPLSTVTRSGRVLCTAGNSPNSTQLLSAMPRVVAVGGMQSIGSVETTLATVVSLDLATLAWGGGGAVPDLPAPCESFSLGQLPGGRLVVAGVEQAITLSTAL